MRHWLLLPARANFHNQKIVEYLPGAKAKPSRPPKQPAGGLLTGRSSASINIITARNQRVTAIARTAGWDTAPFHHHICQLHTESDGLKIREYAEKLDVLYETDSISSRTTTHFPF
jgi:hypothetical protein